MKTKMLWTGLLVLLLFAACTGQTPTPVKTVTPRPSATRTTAPSRTDTAIPPTNTSTRTPYIPPNTRTWTPTFTSPSDTDTPAPTFTRTNTPIVIPPTLTYTRTPSRTSPPPTATFTPGNGIVKFADDFNGGLQSHWHPCPIWWSVTGPGLGGNDPCGRTDQGVRAQAWFVPAAVTVSGGNLVLTASKRATPITYDGLVFPYNSGYTITGQVKPGGWFTYGYFAARLKCPSMLGSWCAFWLWADPNGSNEIDITETLANDPYTHNMNLHGATTWSKSYRMSTPNTEWHTYAVDWQAGRVVWYVDGIETGRYTGSAFNNASMYIILSLQLGGTWAGSVDESKLPTSMLVDFARVFQTKP